MKSKIDAEWVARAAKGSMLFDGDMPPAGHPSGVPSTEPDLTSTIPVGSLRTRLCRCGHSGNGEHPCHHALHTCGKSAKERFYDVKPSALPGKSMKLDARSTWACDEHWNEFEALVEKAKVGT